MPPLVRPDDGDASDASWKTATRTSAKAAEKLGCWLRTDAAACPQVVCSLVYVLQCDSCWDVRREAAWSIARQKVDDQLGYMVLYLAMKLDPHWMVRDAAANALKVVETQLSPGCIREWKAAAAAIEPKCKPYYKPGKDESLSVFASFYTLTARSSSPGESSPRRRPQRRRQQPRRLPPRRSSPRPRCPATRSSRRRCRNKAFPKTISKQKTTRHQREFPCPSRIESFDRVPSTVGARGPPGAGRRRGDVSDACWPGPRPSTRGTKASTPA